MPQDLYILGRDQLSADLNDAHTENEDLKKELENLAAKLEVSVLSSNE